MSEIMSTRYSSTGINTVSHVEIYKGKMTVKDVRKQIYHVRMDYNTVCPAFVTLNFFKETVLPLIENPFVLIITGEDLTIPNQLDPRWRSEEQLKFIRAFYNDIVNHPKLIHCFIENRDELHQKTSSIPIGINPKEMPGKCIDAILDYMKVVPPIMARELKVICIHRSKPGDRQLIDALVQNEWKGFAIKSKNYVKHSWWNLLQSYPFIVCAHGGGIDPCPKVWEALCVGCIPIIKHTALDDIYSNFPVVFVDSWEKDTITIEKLIEWRNKLSKYYEDPELRKEWVHKLYLKYWVERVNSCLPAN
jgi:hypothetical protein